jgi:hypothetical protein
MSAMLASKKCYTVSMTQQRYGRLVILSEMERRFCTLKSGRSIGARQMLCLCECGREHAVVLSNLKSGATKSCGCLKRDVDGLANLTHGKSKTPTYAIWCAMRTRCYNPNSQDFADYGARGIGVCDRWRQSFVNFLQDMGERPAVNMTLDRKDPNLGYSPENCRWTDWVTQASNKRNIKPITHDGLTMTVNAWARHLGIPRQSLGRYLHAGMSIPQAIARANVRRAQSG